MHNAVVAIALSLSGSMVASLQDGPTSGAEPCPHPLGWRPDAAVLTSTLQEHMSWFTAWQNARQPLDVFVKQHPRGRAVLCNANLSGAAWPGVMLAGADLRGADLYEARLEGARLNQADLSGARLAGANLGGADLTLANLDGAFLGPASEPIWTEDGPAVNATRFDAAILNGASLREAVLVWAELNGALLFGTRLEKADLSFARLRGARLERTDLSGAKLVNADLTDATYTPLSSPPNPDVAGIQGIATLRPSAGEPIGLVQLRELLKKAGLRDLEREATFAIERRRTRDQIEVARIRTPATVAEGLFRWLAYDLTTAYGLHPARAMIVLLVAAALLIPVYLVALARAPVPPKRTGGIYRVWPANRIETASDGPRLDAAPRVERLHPGTLGTVGWAAYFSLLSACHIGFREFNVGKWIAAVQAREYELRATGWVRTVSGLQSLLSLYLLAIWVLTYFGRPFG